MTDSGPWEAVIPGQVSLRALWWGRSHNVVEAHPETTTLVLLHGLGDGADIWRPTLKAWPGQPAFPVVALDLPGHGGSDWLDGADYTHEILTQCVARALERLKVASVILVGHSLGAKIALRLSAELQNVVASVLLDMSPADNPLVSAAIAEHLDELMAGAPSQAALVDIYARRLPVSDHDALKDAVPCLATARRAAALADETSGKPQNSSWAIPLDPAVKRLIGGGSEVETEALLRRVSAPVAVARGEFSSVLSAESLKSMRNTLPNCVGVDVIRGAGHALPLEAPTALAQALWRWTSEVLPGAAHAQSVRP